MASVDPEASISFGSKPFRVGGWTVEPDLNQLSAEGRSARIEPKAMAVLCHLAERPGQVVSREALLSAAWPGVVVGDDALTQVVVKLRKALGDSPDEPVFIQTIPKGGYRLVAVVDQEAGSPERQARPESGAARTRGRKWIAGIAATATLLTAAAAVWLAQGKAPGASPPGAQGPIADASRLSNPTMGIRPFEAIGNDPGELLLARGITADLATDLSKVSGIWVVRAPPARGPDGPEAPGAPMPVRYLVTGTVQRLDDRMRLHVHLTDAETGRQLWSERFDRPYRALFEIQDEIGPRVLQALPVKVSEAERRRVAQRYTRNLEAYETFQKGQLALHVRKKTENEAARQLFRQAIELDAGFARAYAALAMTYVADYRNQWVADGPAALDRAFDLARTSHQIDPEIPETHWIQGFVLVHRHRHEQALRHFENAVRVSPSFADGYATMGGLYSSIGRPAEGVPLLRIALRLHPESGYLYFMLLGRAYLFLGDLEQARANLAHALTRNPEFLDARVYMAAVHVESGDRDAAAWEAEEIRALRPEFTVRRWLETNPTADPALQERLVRALGKLGF